MFYQMAKKEGVHFRPNIHPSKVATGTIPATAHKKGACTFNTGQSLGCDDVTTCITENTMCAEQVHERSRKGKTTIQ